MKSRSRLIAVFGLLVGVGLFGLPLASDAGATGGITYYVNSAVDTGATDCAGSTNVDCGFDDAAAAFSADSTVNDADSITRAWVSVALGGRIVITGLRAPRVVRLRVRARNAIGVGPASNTVRVIVR